VEVTGMVEKERIPDSGIVNSYVSEAERRQD